jgi:hypothetical protein
MTEFEFADLVLTPTHISYCSHCLATELYLYFTNICKQIEKNYNKHCKCVLAHYKHTIQLLGSRPYIKSIREKNRFTEQ